MKKGEPGKLSALFTVRVQPKASRNEVRLEPDGRVRVALMAPPVDGKANEALIAYLADCLDLPRRQLTLVRGETSRDKVVFVEGMAQESVLAALSARSTSR